MSNAIETSIHKIPGLAEHFLLANDDTFVGRPLTKEFFFQNGSPIIRLKPGSVANTGSLYREQILHAIELSEQDLHSPIPIFSERNVVPHHNIDAYLKSDYTACTAHFKKEYEKTLTHRFRKGNDVQRIIVDIWAFTHGDADIRIVRPFSKKPKQLDSLMLTNTETDYAKKLNSRNPGLFCINDGELSSQEDRMRTKQFLEKRFPKKSEFEK